VNRRTFIALLGGAAAAWPLASHAQQSERKRRIGVLMAHAENDAEFHDYLSAFREGLQKLGWTEGRNIQIDSRWGALDDAEARQRSAKELIALQPDLILTQNTPPTASMLEQTRTIPVVFVIVADPVGSGFVQSLARPSANATGFTIMEPTIAGKWLELLKEIAPRVNRAAFLFNPATTPYRDIYLKPFKAAAASLALEAIAAPVHDMPELESVVAAHAREPNGSLIVMPDGSYPLMTMRLRCSAVSRAYFLLCVAAATANKHRRWYSIAPSQIRPRIGVRLLGCVPGCIQFLEGTGELHERETGQERGRRGTM
jgi:putative tryptophan/tyrosine transport system substrate-binding protein